MILSALIFTSYADNCLMTTEGAYTLPIAQVKGLKNLVYLSKDKLTTLESLPFF